MVFYMEPSKTNQLMLENYLSQALVQSAGISYSLKMNNVFLLINKVEIPWSGNTPKIHYNLHTSTWCSVVKTK